MTNSNNNVILSVPSGTWRFYDNFTIIFLAFFLPLTFFLHLNDSCITWWARIYLLKATAYLWLVHIRSAAVLCVYQIKILENCWILLDVHRSEREQKKSRKQRKIAAYLWNACKSSCRPCKLLMNTTHRLDSSIQTRK